MFDFSAPPQTFTERDWQYYTGIQVNLSALAVSPDDSGRLARLLNNLGDCYEPERCPLPNTMAQERAAVEKVAQWLHLPASECWGYIGGGSTLGNLQGMWMAATLIRDATLVFSKAAHYSIAKFANALHFNRVKVINAHPTGQLDVADLRKQVAPGEPVVLVLTAGTTMTSAYDPVGACVDILREKSCPFYLHLDAALGGMVVPFLPQAQFPWKEDMTFRNPAISSMTISTHKVLGTPMPANLFVARQSVVEQFKANVHAVPYLNNLEDITVYGSRDGFRAATVFARLNSIGPDVIRRWITDGIEHAQYVTQELRRCGCPGAFAVPGGLAVVIPLTDFYCAFTARHRKSLIDKYHLVQDNQVIHMYMMGHVTRELCDELLMDCRTPDLGC
ncbi:Pyridoxal-dependent decarboxylase [Burkholderia ambifaria IOP40-10]|uniref:Pyridoxal-dependent decarboxylase n=1 Tax=Burkholderia ambifaria IOP40-10 TaxID=396596 RepID=B1FHF6_9BURK|nr:pyridoxal-dependent decarboxylase [Burkholderia ambifaria]EDT03017.1 Pyridoxal-dependent decarboxylase [Burkholderia ambifaria IOP40-10]